ncbi:MAG: trypsin-like peptidase domain-containing protein [Verrucomicrobiales bacterium]|nr:trypsin-like peptidase domain-containing protein [Verrucomicrobiales bacterium]
MDSITIRRLTGTSKGTEETLMTQEVSLGTGPHNTVRYDPTWDRGVAASHARVFRDESGRWWLTDAGSSTGTFVNGQRVTVKRQVNGPIVIELGSKGPKVEVVLPPPLPGAASRTAGGGAGRSQSSGGAGRILVMVACLAVVAAAAWFVINGLGGDSDARLQKVAKNYEAGIGVVIIAEEGTGSPTGTAWAVAPNMFATNAHVAVPVQQALKRGATAYIAINKNPDQRFRVKAAIPHPGYFEERVGVDGKDPATTPYDVGILIIEGTASAVLHTASVAKLESLDSGHRIAFLGFPMEDLQHDGVDPQNPVATMQSGIVTAVTDFWLARSVFQNRGLIQHNLPATGGASGSPIFDADGDVVGILSSVNMIAAMSIEQWAQYRGQIQQAQREAIEEAQKAAEGQPEEKVTELEGKLNATLKALDQIPLPISALKRAPNAAMVNYAQRIDMLEELLKLVQQAVAKGLPGAES